MSGTHSHGGHSHRHGDAGLHVHDPESGDAVPAVPPPRAIAEGVLEIDTLLGGWERVTAGYLIEGTAPVLIETGSQTSVPVLLAALGQIGVGPAELAGVAVTHIHLDHAGGVGDVARAFPTATVYVHEKGARHLADPTRLIDSAARVYGPLLDSLYGRLDPTPPERLHVLDDGEEIDVGPGRTLTAVDSPGHAKHHLGLHDSLSGVLFAGDAVGVKLPDGGVLRPSTPPPDFDLDQALTSLAKFAARRPCGIALAHYGLLEQPDELLAEAEETLRQWAETAEPAYRRGPGHRRRAGGPLRPAPGRHRRRPQGEARHHERRALERGGLPALARRARQPPHLSPPAGPCPGASRRRQTTSLARSSSWRSSKSSSEMRPSARSSWRAANSSSSCVWSTSPADGASGASVRRLVLAPRQAVVHLGLGPILLGLVALQFPECGTCACHGPLLSGRRGRPGATAVIAFAQMRWAFGPRAEEVGFEPTVPMRHNGFRDRPIRPLSHSSGGETSRSGLFRLGGRPLGPFCGEERGQEGAALVRPHAGRTASSWLSRGSTHRL